MKLVKQLGFVLVFGLMQNLFSQNIPTDKVIANENLSEYLTKEIQKELGSKPISEEKLAAYFRDKFSERYFFNWKNFESRFETYKSLYPEAEALHTERALDHLAKFPDATQWVLPFNYQNGEPVNAYALRHLARQHKMVDIAYYYFYQNKDITYLNYFKNQLQSLNSALLAGEYEKIEDGNGVYEAFRSGYRVLNWLQIHNMFLGEEAYSDSDQLITIATLLQHGADLFANNTKFHPGNHQTRGLSALAMISILLRDFEGTDIWYEHAMKLLEEHLAKEINDDGFQFERTVHYHISDIGNYYYVYQLAKLSDYKVNDFWSAKLKSLFVSLTKIAYPNKSAPVLSDDTDNPWGETNDISGALTLGYLLFDDPEFGYFANKTVQSKMFWFVTSDQLASLNNISSEAPTMKSVSFPTTGIYVMREGWNSDDKVMVITAGLDKDKPDHQHGDMLGVQFMAYGKPMLPNYQVRYSLDDLELFKNSMTKNVALVDDELQGKHYTSNKGGSGFGKFKELPQPSTIAWETNDDLDLFVGSHDGFKNVGVNYSRQVIYLKDDFWIVKDNFSSEKPHDYKQVWQGHFSQELAPNLLRATFSDATGLDLYQLQNIDAVSVSGKRGKQWSVVSKSQQKDFAFVTVLYPYKGYDNRIDENKKQVEIKGWVLNHSNWETQGENTLSLTKGNDEVFLSVKSLKIDDVTLQFSAISDVYFSKREGELTIQLLSEEAVECQFISAKHSKKVSLKSGAIFSLTY
ncbi:heparinase II/III family protein [Tamlana sp. 2_MG-2023]|uniref:heparinase II/III family protein n=1 Tax=unclassified Tamlana TaxID=2614803 RepID=UPI0026E33485|nr:MULTISPECIES: heparinase II/III family protein [unclassified Tamlana]MDO6760479.1 heparinase II/III family protein [Tamlana sp. 2_MG-2023]MDO6790735.1 heparinase II/III family protein [Tamlana sp. 1_MG-2023]